MRKIMLIAMLFSSTIYCVGQKISSDTVYLKDGTNSVTPNNNASQALQKKKADSILLKKQWITDSVRLSNYKKDSATYTQRGKLFGNSFADRLGVSQAQRDSLIHADVLIENVKLNARYITDKAVQAAELQQAERQRDISYKEILTAEQYEKYLQIKRQLINSIYIQQAKAPRIK